MEENYNKSLAYLSGDLNSEDVVSFENELKTNTELASETEEWSSLILDVERLGDDEIRNKIKGIEKELDREGFFILDEQILDYLTGNGKEEENQAIEIQLSNNQQFSNRVEEQKLLLKGIEKYGDVQVRKSIEQIVEAPKSNLTVVKRPSIVALWKYAAILVVCSLAGYFWYQNTYPKTELVQVDAPQNAQNQTDTVTPKQIQQEPQQEKIPEKSVVREERKEQLNYMALAKASYTKPKFSGVRSGNRNTLDSAYLLFEQNDFKKVVEIASQPAFQGEWEIESKLLLAHSYLNLNKSSQAISYFKELQSENEILDSDETEYYLLLSYLSDYEHFKNQFDVISSSILKNVQHKFRSQVIRLTQKMKSESN